ncbi:MAG: phosphoadenylyl-sulfate reductase [Rhodobacteraceae bacterium]|nr:phosphoadenylyl-sulfate reductase [Paracoccaceae bacterium]MBR27999.1 phosphoadenylyl-sulfate reductase [Paracoccaceae bacterium]
MPLLDANGPIPETWVKLAEGQAAPKGEKVILEEARLREEGAPRGVSALGVIVGPDADARKLADLLPTLSLVAVRFPSFADGRGFSIARRLRGLGFRGEIRAVGPVIADQFPMLLAVGVDTVEIPEAMAARQPEPQWRDAKEAVSLSYQSGLTRGAVSIFEARRAARGEARGPRADKAAPETPEQMAARLNAKYAGATAQEVLRAGIEKEFRGGISMVSSFGAESAALLHMVSQIDKATPVLFLETGMLFPATLAYQQELAEHLGLTGVRLVRPDHAQVKGEDPDGDLHKDYADSCCDLRKTRPLERALAPFQAWITGRKRFQTADRADLQLFEADANGRIKLNPMAEWDAARISDYMDAHSLPRHPMVSEGFPSLGCAPCTTKVKPGEDPRAGRWRGSDKTECGIHIVDGRVVRGAPQAA